MHFYQKKNFLKLLSMPIILNFFLIKNSTDSDPTRPHEPVIKAIFIKFSYKLINY